MDYLENCATKIRKFWREWGVARQNRALFSVLLLNNPLRIVKRAFNVCSKLLKKEKNQKKERMYLNLRK